MTQFTPPALPAALTARRNWLVWRLVEVDSGKPRKIPYYVSGPARPNAQGTPEDRALLATYDDAVAALQRSQTWERPYTGLGFAPLDDCGLVALDFDNCVTDGAIEPHVEALCEGTYTEFSPSGRGIRAFFTGTLMSHKDVPPNMKGPWPIEVFGHNGFVTVTGNVTPTCEVFGWSDLVAPLTPAVLQMYAARGWSTAERPMEMSADDALMFLKPTIGLTHAQVAEALARLPHDLDYDTWFQVGAAVHHETQGQGFDLWHNWSKESPKYTSEDYCRARWESMGRYRGNVTTFASVLKLAEEQRTKEKYHAVAEWKKTIADTADTFQLKERVCDQIKRDGRLGDNERELVAQQVCDRLREMGEKLPIANCRKLVAPVRERAAEGEVPDWLAPWVYVTGSDKFRNIHTGEEVTNQGFNRAFNRFMPRDESGNVVQNAADAATEVYQVEVVARGVYVPWAGPIFDHQGLRCVNLFLPSSVPQAVEHLDEDARMRCKFLVDHIRMLAGDREVVVQQVLSWMAHNVQKPGVKVRWSPVIKGVQGDGKTKIAEALAAMMGPLNVKIISMSTIESGFTAWGEGASVGVIEELKMHGHNRYDVVNRLKTNITNDTVTVHAKGKTEYQILNTMNYLAFSNYGDAMPIEDGERRYMVIFTPFSSEEELNAAIRKRGWVDPAAYFDRLADVVANHPAELRRFFLDFQLAPSFNANGRAPDTPERGQMIALAYSSDEEAVRDVLAEGAEGVGAKVLSSSCLAEAVIAAGGEPLKTTRVANILTKLGWTRLVSKTRWNGKTHRVWVKGKPPEDVAKALEATNTQKTAGFSEIAMDLFA